MKKDKEETIVIFRKYRDGNIIALFPEMVVDCDGTLCGSYEHVGQHGAASLSLITITNPAKPEEYADLFAELESLGYNLKVYKRIHRRMTEKRIYIANYVFVKKKGGDIN